MDVRQKQLLFKTCFFSLTLRVAGFASRHLNRSVLCGLIRSDVKFRQNFLLLAFGLVVADNFNYELSRLHHD